MRVPETLAHAFEAPFEKLIAGFAVKRGMIPEETALGSPRFLSRSVVPHVEKLSLLFNRDEKDPSSGLSRYWKESSNPANLMLAYFLYFMPSNLFRVAAVWSELERLGFRWSAGDVLKAVEFGAGPASGACGIAAGEHFSPTGLPTTGSWALVEQDRAMLDLGSSWAEEYFRSEGFGGWDVRGYHRTLEPAKGFLPRTAPSFNLWLSSYFLNETSASPRELALSLMDGFDRHLEEEGIAILVEPALRLQSRKLLEIRAELLKLREKKNRDGIQVLLPCLGHQACGALASAEDWCHEEVSWWRPPYYRQIDKMASLDRKTLPFSYLVLAKSRRPREEILPALKGGEASRRYRLVSPAHAEGRELEFFVCGTEGKRRARLKTEKNEEIGRGTILEDAELRGDVNASRIERAKKIL